jgi:pimeloyl-ACP methyl ester carboxylesterase
MRARFLSVGGFRTRLLHDGQGEPLLLIHGLGTTAERWLRNIDPFSAKHAVYAPDLLSSGFTDDGRFGGAPPQRAHLAHLKALITELGLARYAVCGSSYGGLLAALLALDDPERVRRLIIVGSGSALHPAEQQVEVLRAARDNALRAAADATLEGQLRRLRAIAYDPGSIPEAAALALLVSGALPGRAEASLDLYDSLVAAAADPAFQTYPRLEEIRVPTLIVTGRDDPRASWERAVEAQRRLPDCRLEIIERCGHAPMLEYPEAFNALALSFLAPPREIERCAS